MIKGRQRRKYRKKREIIFNIINEYTYHDSQPHTKPELRKGQIGSSCCCKEIEMQDIYGISTWMHWRSVKLLRQQFCPVGKHWNTFFFLDIYGILENISCKRKRFQTFSGSLASSFLVNSLWAAWVLISWSKTFSHGMPCRNGTRFILFPMS